MLCLVRRWTGSRRWEHRRVHQALSASPGDTRTHVHTHAHTHTCDMVLSTMASPTGSVVTRLSQRRRRGRKRRNTKELASKTLPVFSCTVGNALFLHLVYVCVCGPSSLQESSFLVVWRRGRRAGTLVPGCVEEGEESRDLVHTACTVRVVHVGVEHHSAAAPVYITRCLVAVVV